MEKTKKSLKDTLKDVSFSMQNTTLIESHLLEKRSLSDPNMRLGSDAWCEMVEFLRGAQTNIKDSEFSESDKVILNKLDSGKKAWYKNKGSWEKVILDVPQKSDHKSKRFKVYRKTSRTRDDGLPIARVIRFGSSDSNLLIKNDDKTRSDSFWARHKCNLKKDKNTAGWWACYAPELFGNKLGLPGGNTRW